MANYHAITGAAGDESTAAQVIATNPANTERGLVVRTTLGTATNPFRIDPTGTTIQPVSGTISLTPRSLSMATVQATASGDTDLAVPAAGKKVRLFRIELSNSHATAALTVGFRFGAGTIYGKRYLPAVGGADTKNFGDGYVEGAADAKLIVNLSGAGQIEATAYYQEI